MKYAAFVMIALVVIALALGVYTYANARLTLVSATESTAMGLERAAEFADLQRAVDQGGVAGTLYAQPLDGACTDYNFETYTFRFRNKGLIAAEMVEVQPVPETGDMLSFTADDPAQVNANVTVPARGEREVSCVLLVRADQDQATRARRRFTVTYYLWGIPRTMTVEYE